MGKNSTQRDQKQFYKNVRRREDMREEKKKIRREISGVNYKISYIAC